MILFNDTFLEQKIKIRNRFFLFYCQNITEKVNKLHIETS